VASGLGTVATNTLIDAVRKYITVENVDAIVVGLPRDMRGHESESMNYIRPGIAALQNAFPGIKIVFFDERFTSVLAHRAMIDGGMKKSRRRDKAVVDEIAAVIILNDYLQSQQYINDRL